MRLLTFIKNEPLRARRAFMILSAAFCVCFFALIALGIGSAYTRASERDRAAGLTAADILSLKEAYAAAETETVNISRALIADRVSVFLRESDARLLTEMIGTFDARFFGFCTEIESLIGSDSFSAAAFVRLLRAFGENSGIGALNRSVRVQPADFAVRIAGRSSDSAERAAKFIGVRNIFQSDGDCAYCANVCVRFDTATGAVAMYAVECTPGDVRLTENECLMIAVEYAAGRHGIQSPAVSAVTSANGICRVVFVSGGETSAVVGVRMDTGETVFFYRLHG